MAAAVGEHGDPPSACRRARSSAEAASIISRGVRTRWTPGGPERGVDRRAVGGQRAGVGANRAGGGGAVLDREGDHRLAGVGGEHRRRGRTARPSRKSSMYSAISRVCVVAGELVDQLGGVDVGLVAQ